MLQVRSPAAQIKTARFAHASATVSKTPFVLNGKTFIPLDAAAAAALNEHVYEAEISGAEKTSPQVWAAGQTIYFDPATSKFTNVAGALVACGFVIDPALSADTVGGMIAFRGY